MLCGCPRDQLCKLCYEGALANLRGVAACRGEAWAMRTADRVTRSRPWPDTDKARGLAAQKVADVSFDPRLRAELAGILQHWAARWWARI